MLGMALAFSQADVFDFCDSARHHCWPASNIFRVCDTSSQRDLSDEGRRSAIGCAPSRRHISVALTRVPKCGQGRCTNNGVPRLGGRQRYHVRRVAVAPCSRSCPRGARKSANEQSCSSRVHPMPISLPACRQLRRPPATCSWRGGSSCWLLLWPHPTCTQSWRSRPTWGRAKLP